MTDGVAGDDGHAEELAGLERRIEELAEQRFSAGDTCYVSRVGIELGPELARIKFLTGLGLTDFIRNRMSDRYSVFRPRENTDVIWPIGKPYSPSQVPPKSAAAAPRSRASRFDPRIWASFSALPVEGHRFYDPATRTVRIAEVPASDDWIEIGPEFLRKPDEVFAAESVVSNITTWAAQNGVPLEHLSERGLAATLSTAPRERLSALDVLISSLDKRQLQATTVSLDIVAALMRKYV